MNNNNNKNKKEKKNKKWTGQVGDKDKEYKAVFIKFGLEKAFDFSTFAEQYFFYLVLGQSC